MAGYPLHHEKQKMKAFTVVIPYHNRADFLPRTLASIKAQTLRPIQLILVDNNSTDRSAYLCKAFADTQSEENFDIILTSEERPGAAAARNAGLALAKGEWVLFFDSDDEMSPTFLSDARQAFEHDECDAVAAATRMIFADGRSKVRTTYHTTDISDQIITGMLATQGMAFRTDFLRYIGGWIEVPVWNDWLLGINLLLHRPRLAWLPLPYHRIYQHPDSLTGSSFSTRTDTLREALRAARILLEKSEHAGSREMAALAARWAILAGQLKHEGNSSAAVSFYTEAMAARGSLSTFIARTLYLYTAFGGRGAWRIARRLLCGPNRNVPVF